MEFAVMANAVLQGVCLCEADMSGTVLDGLYSAQVSRIACPLAPQRLVLFRGLLARPIMI